jgi:uncharacterized protein
VKLAVRERETEALRDYLHVDPMLVSSAVAIVEVQRGARIADPRGGARKARAVLDRVALLDVDRVLLEEAVSISSAHVRPLDAIHIATAVRAGARTMLVYDRRLAEAAQAAGLEILAPGT